MTEISSAGMVTYYNHITMYRQQQQQAGMHQQHLTSQQQQQAAATAAAVVAGAAAAAAAEGSQQYWYGYPHGHPSSGSSHQSSPGSQHQYLDHLSSASGDVLGCSWPPHAHPYSHHIPYQQQLYHHQNQQSPMTSTPTPTDWSMSKNHNNNNNSNNNNNNNNGLANGEPSPPITISGSEISSPGTPASPNISNLNATNNTNTSSSASTTPVRPAPVRSPFEWMKKSSYIHGQNPGKTRTKDKYRVVYTDHQRLELEKEFHFSRYITIRRKAELATHLALSERQVKIWFQNRRAKERKQVKKREELEQKDIKPNIIHQEGLQTPGGMVALSALSGMTGMLSGLMHNGNSPPLNLGPQAHSLGLSHPNSHAHAHQHVHPHSVLGL